MAGIGHIEKYDETDFPRIPALFFVVAGVNHFLPAAVYVEVMPRYIPWPVAMVYLSGVAEAVLGGAVLLPRLRELAMWGLIALLVAVFPANIDMAVHGFHAVPRWILWARLPFQAVLIAWVYWSCQGEKYAPSGTNQVVTRSGSTE